jgi:hypothetical protein
MLFKQYFTVAFAGMVVASPISDAISTITTALGGLETSILEWQKVTPKTSEEFAKKALTVLEKAEGILSTIGKATDAVKAMQPLPLTEAVTVLQPANALVKGTTKTIDLLISFKDDVTAVSLASTAGGVLGKFKVSAASLLAAIREKLPDNVKTVGDSIGKQINSALDKGITAFPAS